jgi:hypothetical protein
VEKPCRAQAFGCDFDVQSLFNLSAEQLDSHNKFSKVVDFRRRLCRAGGSPDIEWLTLAGELPNTFIFAHKREGHRRPRLCEAHGAMVPKWLLC